MKLIKQMYNLSIDTDVIKAGDKISYKMPVFCGCPNDELHDKGNGVVLSVSKNEITIEYLSDITNEIKRVNISAERIDHGDFYIDLIEEEY